MITIDDYKKKIEELEKEVARLTEEINVPRCHDCHEVLGDNWCMDCARKCYEKQHDPGT